MLGVYTKSIYCHPSHECHASCPAKVNRKMLEVDNQFSDKDKSIISHCTGEGNDKPLYFSKKTQYIENIFKNII